jgi:hypothetical protein
MAILRWTLTSSQNFSWLKHKLRERKSAPKVSLDDQGEPVAVAVAVAVAVDVSGGLGSGVAARMVFSTVFGSGFFSVLGAWVVSSTAVGPRSDVGGGSLFTSDPAKKAASADSKNTNTILIIHSRARPHLEVLEATDQNLSHIFSPRPTSRYTYTC